MNPSPPPAKKKPRRRAPRADTDAAAFAKIALGEAAKAVTDERPADALSYIKLAQGFERLAETAQSKIAPPEPDAEEAALAQGLFELAAKLAWLMLYDPSAAPQAFQAQIGAWLIVHAPMIGESGARAIAQRALRRFLEAAA